MLDKGILIFPDAWNRQYSQRGVAIKQAVRIILIMLIVFVDFFLFFTWLVLSHNGTIHEGGINCFDVDSAGDLYVGYTRAIEVYHEGEWVRTISPQTSRGYKFCIENDEIYIGGSGHAVMSLEGEVLRKCSDSEVRSAAGGLFNKSMEKDGKTYRLLTHAGFKRAEILRDGERIFQESKADCFWNGAYFWLIWGVFFLILFFLLIDFFASEGMVGNWWK